MKDWWHDDFKNGKVVEFKEICIDGEQHPTGFTRASPERSVEYSIKGAKTTSGKLASINHKQYSNSKTKKDPVKEKDLLINTAQYNESLKILEKLREKEGSSKRKLEPLRKDKENGMTTPTKELEKRPLSGSAKKGESKKKDDFKLRFSTNIESGGILKLNKR